MNYAFIYFLFFIGFGSYFSTLSPYILEHFAGQSSAIFAAGQITFILGVFVSGYLSDRLKKLRALLLPSLFLQGFSHFFLFSSRSATEALFWNGSTRFFFAMSAQIIGIASLEGRGTYQFAQTRAWGTAGFLIAQSSLFFLVFTGKMPGLSGEQFAGKAGAIFYFVAFAAAFTVQRHRQTDEKYYFRHALSLLRIPRVSYFFLLSFLFYFSYQLVDYYIGRFLQQRGGLGTVYGGWALAVILELPFMPVSSRIAARFGIKSLFYISLVTGALRFLWLYQAATAGSSSAVVFSQILHGVHYTGYYMGSLLWMRKMFPDHLYGTASGMHTILSAVGGGLTGNLFFGYLLSRSAGNEGAGFSDQFLLASTIHITLIFLFLALRVETRDRRTIPV